MDRDVFAVHSDLERTHWWFTARRAILRRVVDALGARPGDTVLDIGCGVGATLAAFHPDYRAVGFDPSPDAIEFGRARHPGIDLRVGGVEEAGAFVAAADVVLLNDVIEHVPDDRALLAPLVGRMRPGSLLVITVPADMRLWSPHDVALGHHRRYDRDLLARAVDGLALRTVFVSHFNARLYPLVRLARAVARLRGESAGEKGTDLRPTPRPLNALLHRAFAGEAGRLARIAEGKAAPYRHGVSLIGAYRRV
ncbi:MAG TPA: class I SAM-dependent methyltransferase [Usitatibacter sp.]|nr:class I SAM-dependent methyltransferase [Usitatibacter sp.]